MGVRSLTGDRAVFLDRDGVINSNVFNPATRTFESPLRVEDFRLTLGALPALSRIRDECCRLFLVSNQPNYAKGKASLAVLDAIHERLLESLSAAGIVFSGYYYCLHHPE